MHPDRARPIQIRLQDPRPETVLLCKNSLVSIGLKHLPDGTCFALTGTAADERSIFTCDQSTALTLFIMDGSDFSSRIAEAAGSLRSIYPDARIAIIADRFDVRFIKQARDAGVNGFCQSACSQEVFIKSHEPVMLGEVVLPTDIGPYCSTQFQRPQICGLRVKPEHRWRR